LNGHGGHHGDYHVQERDCRGDDGDHHCDHRDAHQCYYELFRVHDDRHDHDCVQLSEHEDGLDDDLQHYCDYAYCAHFRARDGGHEDFVGEEGYE
jgi:hypothetical protein